jgi:hypothetical protein
LLTDVGQFVREHAHSRRRLGLVSPAGEDDVRANGIRVGVDGRGCAVGVRTRVNANVAKIRAEMALHPAANVGVEWPSRALEDRCVWAARVDPCIQSVAPFTVTRRWEQ